MSKLEEFLVAWRTRFPGADVPPNVVECLSAGNKGGMNDVLQSTRTRIDALQNELHQSEFVASFLWESINSSNDVSPTEDFGDLDCHIPVQDSPSDPKDTGCYDNIPQSNDPSPVKEDQCDGTPDSIQPSQILRAQPKPVPAPRPSTHVPSVKERASAFVMQNTKGPSSPPPNLPTRGNSLDSKKPADKTETATLIVPQKPSKPFPPTKPRKPVHNYEEIDMLADDSPNTMRNERPPLTYQNSVESNSFKNTVFYVRTPVSSQGSFHGTHMNANERPSASNYEMVSSFKPHAVKPKTSSLSPQLKRGSPVYLSKHKHDRPNISGDTEVYDEPIPVTSNSNVAEDSSSDEEEPIYHNLMLLKKQQQQSMDNRLFGSMDIHKLRLERDAKKLSHRYSRHPDVLLRTAKAVAPPVMRPIVTSTVIVGVTEDDSSTEPGSSATRRCDSVESFGSGGERSLDSALDSAGSSGSVLDEGAWRKQQSMSKASSQESIFSEMHLDAPVIAETERLTIRKNVVQSILDSEGAYTKTLDVLNQYMNSLMGVVDKPLHQIIPREDIETIFFGIPELHSMHLDFIRNLQPRMQQWGPETQVADLFKILAVEECAIATKYLENYQRAVTAIHKCSQDPKFKDLISQIKVMGVKEAPSLEELLHKPVVRFQRNTLVLHDLIGCTPICHPDYDMLQKTLKIAQNFLENFQTPQDKDLTADQQRYLARHNALVEKVGNTRKLRHVFLFNDMIVCSKQKVSGKKLWHELKWAIPLLDLTLDDRVSEEEHQVASHRIMIGEQQREIAELQAQIKLEMKKVRGNADQPVHRNWSMRSHNKTIEKLKKKLVELELQMMVNSPHLHFRLKNKSGKMYTLLLSSDYERTNWRDAIVGLKCKVTGSCSMNGSDVEKLINKVKMPKVAGNMLEDDDSWLFEEEHLFGLLNITIHCLVGLRLPADTYICVELDSFGHFFLKAKTETIHKTREPSWEKDFELDLEGAQTLRLLCYKEQPPSEVLLGKCALELSKAWLRGDYQEQNIPINDEMSISVSLRYASREKIRCSTLTTVGVFGADIVPVARREGKSIPIIVTACVKEVERRGLKEVGIYRVSGMSSDIIELKNAFDKNSRTSVALLQEFEINVVASLLKSYLRELPEPLLTDALYAQLVQGLVLTDPESKENMLMSCVQALPDVNLNTLLFLLDHMLKISDYSNDNKMSLQNLATVFGPTLLQPNKKSNTPITMELFTENAKQAMAQTGVLLTLLQMRQRGWGQNTKL